MTRSKDAWLNGPGDLKEATVEDVPVPGETVQVRALSARYSAEVQGQLKLVQDGREQVAKIDVPSMELLQFQHGCIDPQFTLEEARAIQERFGPAFRKVVAKIDELSGIDKEAVEAVEQRFPDSGAVEAGADGDLGVAAGSGGPAVPLRASA
jgi:hypothetical protein